MSNPNVAPDRSRRPELPPYTYVPGHAPHPISDDEGHMRGLEDSHLPATWSHRDHLLWGVHLFQHGYYWEAHEAWEHLWLDLGRTTRAALIVKGMIKLAASGVKCREGKLTGATRHAARAAELLQTGSDLPLFAGGFVDRALAAARRIVEQPPVAYVAPSSVPVPLPGLEI